MQGKFEFDSPKWRAIVDAYLSFIFVDRCGGMEVAVRNETGDVSNATNQLVLVIAEDAGAQYNKMKGEGVYTEDFAEFEYVSRYMKIHSGLTCFYGVVVDKERNVAVTFFDGNSKEAAARSLIGLAPAYFRYLFCGENRLTKRERDFAVRVANPAVALKDVI